jgi:hypothetical protein
VYTLWHAEIRHWITAILVFGLTVCAWFLPMLIASGGGDLYFTALNDLWTRTLPANTVPAMIDKGSLLGGVMVAVIHLLLICLFYLITFSALAPIIFMRGLSLGDWADQKQFVLIWIVPGLLFFTFMYLSVTNMGYMAAIFPPLFLIIGAKTAKWYQQAKSGWKKKTGFVAFVLLMNSVVFLYVPFYMGYQDTKKYENDILLARDALNQATEPYVENTLVVAVDAYRRGFREAGYYSPEYFVVQYPEMALLADIKVFAMHDRKTIILDKIPMEKYPRFVIFPTRHDEHIQEVLWAMFPEGSVSKKSKNGYTFIEGPSSELKYLFPQTAAQ